MAGTRRLYYENAYRAEFEATLLQVTEYEGKPAVLLDATCFYPTSGGQPHDLGTLNGVQIVDVVEAGEDILHLLATPLAPGPVRGIIDWNRRFDHMQQHSGQHILSQAFERELQADTVSFHLGNASSTIDVTLGSLDWDLAARIEELTNRIVFEDRPVTVREYSAAEVGALALRKAPIDKGIIRVVTVQDFDVCACGGTHVRATGEVGCIHIRGWERRRGQVRVEFLCGWRALHDYRTENVTCQDLANRFSVGIGELPLAFSRLTEAEQTARQQMESLRKRLLDYELPHLADEAVQVGGVRVLCRLLEGYDAGNMRYLAQNLIREPGRAVLLAVVEPTPQLCFARSEDTPLDMVQLFREVVTPYGGRGGGRPHVAQGGGIPAAQVGEVLDRALERLQGMILSSEIERRS